MELEIITHISYCIIFGIMAYSITRNYAMINKLTSQTKARTEEA